MWRSQGSPDCRDASPLDHAFVDAAQIVDLGLVPGLIGSKFPDKTRNIETILVR